jgi:hypothetical protein
MDQLWDLPTDFNFDQEEKRIKEKFIGICSLLSW